MKNVGNKAVGQFTQTRPELLGPTSCLAQKKTEKGNKRKT